MRCGCAYPKWTGGNVDISFSEKYSPHDGGSAGTAFAVLFLSSLEGFDIDPKFAFTGDITVDWKVRQVGAVAAKLHGAIVDHCSYAAIPEENETSFADSGIFYGHSAYWSMQVFSIATLQQAVGLVRTDRAAGITEAMRLFAALQPDLLKSERTTLMKPETQATLKHILELAPNHLSAKYALQVADGSAPRTLSAAATTYRLSVILYPYRAVLSGSQPLDRASLPATLTVTSRNRLDALRPIADKHLSPLVIDVAAFVETLDEYVGGRATAVTLRGKAQAVENELDAISNDKDFIEKMVKEGY